MSIQNLAVAADITLNLENIQGDILVGMQKDAELFVLFTIDDVAAFKSRLPVLATTVTSTLKVVEREGVILRAKSSHSGVRLDLFGLNIGFTSKGLAKLLGTDEVADAPGVDPSFVAGAKSRAEDLGDQVDAWLDPFASDIADGVLLVTGPEATKVTVHADKILQSLAPTITAIYSELGETRPQRGHEHFGFLDGVSQPGIRGLTEPLNPEDETQGLPGQDLIYPGEFVFGYPGQVDRLVDPEATKDTQGPIVEAPLPWMRDGSYMVFRRLEQRVLAFREFVEGEAARLGMDKGLLAARLVGRWPSGAPLVLAPLQDDFGLGANDMANNAFEYQEDDPFQRRCPYAAHIRKTYPRDDLNDALDPAGNPIEALAGAGGEASVQTRRLRRAGIPFGPEVSDAEAVVDEGSRGLMFVCYQTSIVDQFEFVQRDWANAPDFVIGKGRPNGSGTVVPGHDPIIGQTADDARTFDEPVPNYPMGNVRSASAIGTRFVQATGAGYFFMPAISALAAGPLAQPTP